MAGFEAVQGVVLGQANEEEGCRIQGDCCAVSLRWDVMPTSISAVSRLLIHREDADLEYNRVCLF